MTKGQGKIGIPVGDGDQYSIIGPMGRPMARVEDQD
jgi:hypothetical protein